MHCIDSGHRTEMMASTMALFWAAVTERGSLRFAATSNVSRTCATPQDGSIIIYAHVLDTLYIEPIVHICEDSENCMAQWSDNNMSISPSRCPVEHRPGARTYAPHAEWRQITW